MLRNMEGRFTSDDGDQYLDATQFITDLEKAVRQRQIDKSGMLEKLGLAAVHCRNRAAEHKNQATGHRQRSRLYTAANAIYLAKIKELTSSNWERSGFKGWCKMHGFARSTAETLAKIGAQDDPVIALQQFRDKNREQVYDSLERATGYRPISRRDPLGRIKAEWHRLSAKQRLVFLDWILAQSPLQDDVRAAAVSAAVGPMTG